MGKKEFKSSKKTLLSKKKNIEDRKKFGDLVEKSGYLTPGIPSEKLRSNIFFSDESWIELYGQGHSQNRRYRNENREDVSCTQALKFDVNVLVAGGISRGWCIKVSFRSEGTNNYCDLLSRPYTLSIF